MATDCQKATDVKFRAGGEVQCFPVSHNLRRHDAHKWPAKRFGQPKKSTTSTTCTPGMADPPERMPRPPNGGLFHPKSFDGQQRSAHPTSARAVATGETLGAYPQHEVLTYCHTIPQGKSTATEASIVDGQGLPHRGSKHKPPWFTW